MDGWQSVRRAAGWTFGLVTALTLGTGLMMASSALAAPPTEDHPTVKSHIVAIGSGEVEGAFYPEAGAVCRMVNRNRSQHGIHCLVEPTSGSGANLGGLRSGDLQAAILQSHSLADAIAGKGLFAKDGPFADLRSLVSLHGEPVAVLLAANTKIKSLPDLKGKRVNLGRPGSYQRLMADAVLSMGAVQPPELASGLELDTTRAVKSLCDSQIDAAIITGIHPITEVQEALDDCGATLLPLKDAAIESYLKNNPGFSRLTIGTADYQGLRDTVPTIGLRAVLVTTKSLPDEDAYAIVKAVAGDYGAFAGLHPLLGNLNRKQMARESLVAPLHEGAIRYFKENGLP